LIGSIGEKIVWTSSFDGLGRLVARELLRPLRLDDSPTCDFSLDEANVLVDPKLADPLVHLRIKQARLLTVSLLPGVTVALPLQDISTDSSGRSEQNRRLSSADRAERRDPVTAFVDAVWPYLESRIDDHLRSSLGSKALIGGVDSQRNREKNRSEGTRPPSSKTSKRP
jgi:hypothetical protein